MGDREPWLFPTGVLELELTRLPQPAQHPQNCTPMGQGTPQSPWPWRVMRAPSRLSLFRQRRVRGWWPCTVQEGSKRRLSVGGRGTPMMGGGC